MQCPEKAESVEEVEAPEADHGGSTEEKSELIPGTGHRRRSTLSSSLSLRNSAIFLSILKECPERGEAGAPDTDPGSERAPEEKNDRLHCPEYNQSTLSNDDKPLRSSPLSLKDQSSGSEWWKKLCIILSVILGFLLAVITVVVLRIKMGNAPACKCLSCPNKWTKYDDICYFMSKNSTVWKESRQYCEKEGGSLLILNDTVQQQIEELFVLRYDHWIGLQRDPDSKGWKWVNGAIYRDSVRDGNDQRMNCAYINGGIGALDCSSPRPWICMKSLWSGHISRDETS